MFREVKKEETFPQIEERVLALWDKDDSFKKSLDSRPETEPYTFYEGPPFATGLPHYGHLQAGTIKDIVPRYWTMKGKKVPRGFGWDCHGLPIESPVQNELGLAGVAEIQKLGVDKFNETCRGKVLKYVTPDQLSRHYKIYPADYVSAEDGTGAVHTAPSFGEEDFQKGAELDLGLFDPLDTEGKFTDKVPMWKGLGAKEADMEIIRYFKEQGRVFKQDVIVLSYPHCWRTGVPLIYCALKTWLLKIDELFMEGGRFPLAATA